MSTFIGDFVCKADPKGRFVLPAAFKREMNGGGDRFVVRKDFFENCLVMFPYLEWEQELARIRSKLNLYNKEHNSFYRELFRGSAEISFDAAGRILIPKRLIETIGSPKEVVMLGVDSKIEIWDQTIYANNKLGDEAIGDLAGKILGGGLPDILGG